MSTKGARVRPIDTSKALPGSARRQFLDHLNELLEASQVDLAAALPARTLYHQVLRSWARAAGAPALERIAEADQDPARIALQIPGVLLGDQRGRASGAVRSLVEHGWLVPHRLGPNVTAYHGELGQPFGIRS